MQVRRLLTIGLVIGFAIHLSACRGGDEKKPSEKLIGKWKIDAEATMKRAKEEVAAEAASESASQLGKDWGELQVELMQAADRTFIFTDDNKMTMVDFQTEKSEFTYKVINESKDSVTFALGSDGEPQEVTVTFLDDNTIEYGGPGYGTSVLRRVTWKDKLFGQ